MKSSALLAAAMLFPGAGSMLPQSASGSQQAVFRVESRLVEVCATVLDRRGRYVDGLTAERFQVLDNGQPQPLAAFETEAMELSLAILLDTTGSMERALPVVKNAALKLIGRLRPEDLVAVYSFDVGLARLADFTTDRNAAKRAVLRTRPSGRTALFDAVAQVGREVSRRQGKKAIVVFTDGQDNASTLSAQSAGGRAKRAGVPVYAVAYGEAIRSRELVEQLRVMAQSTGGIAYLARKSDDIEEIFLEISQGLKHIYMLAYQAPPVQEPGWRTIRVSVTGLKDYKIRAKEGYSPE